MVRIYDHAKLIDEFNNRLCNYYPDGTRILTVKHPFDLIEWNYENDSELFVIIALKEWADERGDTVISSAKTMSFEQRALIRGPFDLL